MIITQFFLYIYSIIVVHFDIGLIEYTYISTNHVLQETIQSQKNPKVKRTHGFCCLRDESRRTPPALLLRAGPMRVRATPSSRTGACCVFSDAARAAVPLAFVAPRRRAPPPPPRPRPRA